MGYFHLFSGSILIYQRVYVYSRVNCCKSLRHPLAWTKRNLQIFVQQHCNTWFGCCHMIILLQQAAACSSCWSCSHRFCGPESWNYWLHARRISCVFSPPLIGYETQEQVYYLHVWPSNILTNMWKIHWFGRSDPVGHDLWKESLLHVRVQFQLSLLIQSYE